MSHNATVKTVIIIDNCAYSLMGIEAFIAKFRPEIPVFSFECTSDYRLWQRTASHGYEPAYLIINTSATSLYGDDTVSLLRHEMNNEEKHGVATQILFLTRQHRQPKDSNAIRAHYLLNEPPLKTRVQVFNIIKLNIGDIGDIIRGFVNSHTVSRPLSAAGAKKTFTTADMRAMNILLSARSVSFWSSYYCVNPKTIYTQRQSMLYKLFPADA